MDTTRARRWHLVTAVVVVGALLLQLALVLAGEGVLLEEDPPSKVEQLGRFFSYFTIQSNLLGAAGVLALALDADRDGRAWRAVRLAGVVGLAVTALVHFFLLRPLLDLEGLSYLCDKLLHMVSPAMIVVGWLVFGPRPRVTRREVGWSLGWVLAWTGWTLGVGAVTGWFPYPFLDFDAKGWGAVVVALVGITVVFAVFFGVAGWLDRRLSPAPRSGSAPRQTLSRPTRP
jgi:hypothetical protein